MQIAAAYEALADNEKRKLYDQVGTYIHARMHVGGARLSHRVSLRGSNCRAIMVYVLL